MGEDLATLWGVRNPDEFDPFAWAKTGTDPIDEYLRRHTWSDEFKTAMKWAAEGAPPELHGPGMDVDGIREKWPRALLVAAHGYDRFMRARWTDQNWEIFDPAPLLTPKRSS